MPKPWSPSTCSGTEEQACGGGATRRTATVAGAGSLNLVFPACVDPARRAA
ncbi:hypothetical protein RI056_07000 [Komagataeibacter nataicola]|uniref:hypothetical protein n=1 Tax=Komagataeibacter nataicola TaxID=265960 RepID=UPI0028ABD835|nr:hypothetical protein [Komagataeibacter nataicola]WNM09660.1 hypothetical protein RI056_07000 [Komagataeibacter nataicola]